MRELILGGARSGKSRLAEQYAQQTGLDLIYVATATANDEEMAQRIQHHRYYRDKRWQVVEEPLQLATTLLEHNSPSCCMLVDCLTLWLSNCLHANCWAQQKQLLLGTLPKLQAHIIMVSNETGLGVVPMGRLSREFVDQSGFFHQQLTALCDRVTLTVAGLPVVLKA
jgi:adenosylcobinamide kinase/adenosylcobinamide-phosphate guanylyltransferase